MLKLIVLVMSITVYRTTNADNDTDAEFEPLCERAITPFINESDVLEEVTHWLNCGFNYWKAGNPFYGITGFRAMFGEEGHIWNTSSLVETDHISIRGYYPLLTNNVVSQNLVTFSTAPHEIYIHNFSDYTVFYSWRMGIIFNPLNVAQLNAKEVFVRTFSQRVYFSDGSGIVKHEWSNSTKSKFGHLIQKMFTTTEAMAGMMGAFEDEPDFDVGSTIVYIFMCILGVSLLTIMIIVCTCIGCAAKKFNRSQLDVGNIAAAIDMMKFEGSVNSFDSHSGHKPLHSTQHTIL